MRSLIRRLTTVAAAVAVTAALPVAAFGGKGGLGGMSGGMSRSMSGSMSRSMGGMSGMSSRSMSGAMNQRSMGASSMSSSRFSSQLRSMGGSSFNSRSIPAGGATRTMGGSVTRNLGGSQFGGAKIPSANLNNAVRNLPGAGSFKSKSPITTTRPDLGRQLGKQFDSRLVKNLDRGVVRDLSKGKLGGVVGRGVAKDFGKSKLADFAKDRVGRDRVTDLIKGRTQPKNMAGRTGSLITDRLKTGRIRTGDLAKIDRSKLRDLVRGMESGKTRVGRGSLPIGGKAGPFDGFDKSFHKGQIADAILNGGLKPFNPGNVFGGGKGSSKSGVASMLAAACFPHHHHHDHHHHHGHWFDFCFGDFWFDCYDYPHYEPYCYDYAYDYCSYPAYTYPTCGVTFTTDPEVMTVAATQPVFLDQQIDLVAATEELETDKPVIDEPATENTDQPGTAVAVTASDETTDSDAAETTAIEAATADESSADATSEDETVDSAIAGTGATDELTADPAVQPDMDLELIDVQLVEAGNAAANQGPSFKVTVRNSGKQDLAKFLVSLVACKDAQIDSNSVHGSSTVDELAAGGEATVTVTLPVESLSLNRDEQGGMAPYQTLVAAVDSDERVNEGNEENNLALIDRTSIKLAKN